MSNHINITIMMTSTNDKPTTSGINNRPFFFKLFKFFFRNKNSVEHEIQKKLDNHTFSKDFINGGCTG